ncbi:MAG: hypothetical protein IT307_04710 [Chloroflexi bacterium]|nr:hypothetical protein [Chloroflexota bacterium]
MAELSLQAALDLLASTSFNLLKTTAEGALVMSVDHWRLSTRQSGALVMGAEPTPDGNVAEPLVVAFDDLLRITWDRLPRQRKRAQIRLYFRNGDRWTFSGHMPDEMEPSL